MLNLARNRRRKSVERYIDEALAVGEVFHFFTERSTLGMWATLVCIVRQGCSQDRCIGDAIDWVQGLNLKLHQEDNLLYSKCCTWC